MPLPSSKPGLELSRTDTANFFGVSMTGVDYWRTSGCPHIKRGTAVLFNSKEVVEWLQNKAREKATRSSEDGDTIEGLKLRRERAETERAERVNEIEAGQVVKIEDSEGIVAEIIAVLCSQHEAMPARFAAPLAYRVAALIPDAAAGLIEEIRRAVEAGLKDCSDEMRTAIAAGEGLSDLFSGESESSPITA